MTTEPPENDPSQDPFRKPPPSGPGGGDPYGAGGTPGGDPYGGGAPGAGPYGGGSGGPGGGPYGGGGGPGGGPYGGGPYGGGPYGGGPFGGDPYGADPLAGMPPLASGGKRVLARLIDMIIVGLVVWLLSVAFGIGQFNVNSNHVNYASGVGQSVLAAVLYTAYDTVFISRTGQTPGKQLLKLRVANLHDGATPSVQTSLTRAAVLWLPFAFCCACIWTAICGGWSFFDRPYRQGLHDKAAKTVEVSTE
ncbi:RDD family protein [Streptomyces sp. NPDC058045]|uniref:RDD family protein n=1 Tax=Streptomyces sp. NPDC058045 TaxID=3346311 RepID=UPI0036EA6FBF